MTTITRMTKAELAALVAHQAEEISAMRAELSSLRVALEAARPAAPAEPVRPAPSNVHALLKGVPVLVCRRGVYPNKAEMADITQRLFKTHSVRVESAYIGGATRFVVTAERRARQAA